MHMTRSSARMFAAAFTALAIFAAGALFAGAQSANRALKAGEKIHLNPAGMFKPSTYTHVISAQPGRVIFISGQVAFNEKGELVGKGDLRAQTVQVLENLSTALKASGASWSDVVKITTYVVNYSPDTLAVLREVRGKYIGTGPNPPTSTLVGIQALASPDLLIEIEAIAVIR